MAVSVALTLITLQAGPAAAAPSLGAGKAALSRVTLPRPDDQVAEHAAMAAALAQAKKADKPVEVPTAASENSTTWARPDGRLVTELYSGPYQVKRADGSWSRIDTTLVTSDGALIPKTAKADVRFSVGGQDPFAQMRYGEGRSVALRWSSSLPKPEVKGNTATYQGVAGQKGDLVVKALPTGMRFDVILRERQAQPIALRIPIELNGLDIGSASDGQLRLTKDKRPIAALTAPAMWGAGPTGRADGTHGRRGDRGHAGKITARVEKNGKGDVLLLEPDAAFLADPATKYPVTLDPSILLPLNDDTDVNSIFDGNNVDSEYLKAGTDSGGEKARAYLRFDTSTLPTSMTSAELNLRNVDAPSCGTEVGGGIQVRRVTGSWDANTIDWSPQPTNTAEDAVTSREGSQAYICGSGFMRWDITGIVRDWQAGAANHGLVLQAPSETASNGYRVFTSSEEAMEFNSPPKLTVTYQLPPVVPEVTLTAVDSLRGNNAVIEDGMAALTYLSSSVDGQSINYTTTITESINPVTAPGPTTGDSGQTVSRAINLGNANSVKFSVKACLNGVTPANCTTTPLYRVTSDAALTPTPVGTDLNEPANPVLFGTVARPSGKAITGKFYLYTSTGTPIGARPIGEGTIDSGQRISLRLPVGAVQLGASYQWRLQACTASMCTTESPAQQFTVPAGPPPPPTGTQPITLDKTALTVKGAQSANDACNGGPCVLTTSTTVNIGGDGDASRLSWLKLNLSSLPAGARVTQATLNLGSPSCAPASCAPTNQIAVYTSITEVTQSTTGAEVAAGLDAEPHTQVTISQPEIDVTGIVNRWIEEPSADNGLVLMAMGTSVPETAFGSPDATTPLSVRIDYVPATAPGPVTGLQARSGHQGVRVTWATPEESGSNADVNGYDVRLLDSGSTVLREVARSANEAVLTGLTNGASYRVQVRARSDYGTSAWAQTDLFSPQAVPGGAEQYLDAIRQYETVKNELLQGDRTSVDDALTDKSQAQLVRAILHAQGGDFIDWANQAADRNMAQLSSTVTLKNSLVSYLAQNGEVIVHTEVATEVVYAGEVGTPDQEAETGSQSATRDFAFRAADNKVGMLRSTLSGADDPTRRSGQLNAEASGITVPALPGDATPLPVDQDGFPIFDTSGQKSAPAQAAATVNRGAIADWALGNLAEPTDFDNDCANFISKAIYNGGRAKMAVPPGALSALTSKADPKWWYQSVPKRYLSSYSWSAAHNFYQHFIQKRARATWVPSWSAVRRGDVLLWDWYGKGTFGHVAVVSKVTTATWKGVYYAQHQPTYDYRPLAVSYPATKKQYPNMKVYAIRINW
ncbi:DNRLRE domain-containing protein [Streptosporangium canum]|uniref:DNRLRE domain-containing protein n=1 Tax=Streptosporangium canum TaxID=324952 RepID=UPI0036B35ED9